MNITYWYIDSWSQHPLQPKHIKILQLLLSANAHIHCPLPFKFVCLLNNMISIMLQRISYCTFVVRHFTGKKMGLLIFINVEIIVLWKHLKITLAFLLQHYIDCLHAFVINYTSLCMFMLYSTCGKYIKHWSLYKY